jgi:hypothetical protein
MLNGMQNLRVIKSALHAVADMLRIMVVIVIFFGKT